MSWRKEVAKILIVDDDPDLREGQKLFLKGKCHTVETADSMEQGVEKVAAFTPDLIVVDLMMEHYDTGFVFCHKVRDIRGMEETPIIMQTAAPRKIGFTFDASDTQGKKWMKVNEVLVKPVALEDLLGKIEQYV
jgi:CheY-like chemotaxis protein